jgi:hypothetical protein
MSNAQGLGLYNMQQTKPQPVPVRPIPQYVAPVTSTAPAVVETNEDDDYDM